MSKQLISHSPELQRLRDEGYHIDRGPTISFSKTFLRDRRENRCIRNTCSWKSRPSVPQRPRPIRMSCRSLARFPATTTESSWPNLSISRGNSLGGDLIASCSFSHNAGRRVSQLLREDDHICEHAARPFAQALDRTVMPRTYPAISLTLTSPCSATWIQPAVERKSVR